MDYDLSGLIAYHKEFRVAFFTASFTLGTFLFTMKSFIVQVMKREVYDKPSYQAKIRSRKKHGATTTYYSQLQNFANVLTAAILFSFFNAVMQITIGYVGTLFSTIFSLATSLVALLLVLWALALVVTNIRSMIEIAEEDITETKDDSNS